MNIFKSKVSDDEVKVLMEEQQEKAEEEIKRRKWVMENVVAMVIEETSSTDRVIGLANAAYDWVFGVKP